MARRHHRVVVLLVVMLALVGCGVGAAKEPPETPSEVVEKFYRWCIGYPGNPTVDRAYRTSPYLAPAFIEEVDAVVAAPAQSGADPLLLAQDIPERFTVGDARVTGDDASVLVDFYWSGNDVPSQRVIELQIIDGAWRIVDIRLEP